MERVVTRVPALTHDLIRSHARAGNSEWQTLQIIDNLNASIRLRALLTDLFLIGEILKGARHAVKPVVTS